MNLKTIPLKKLNFSLFLGAFIIAIFTFFALISVFYTPYDVTKLSVISRLQTPTLNHWLGTDHLGRDLLSMIMSGAKVTLIVAFMSVAIGMLVGIPLGLAAAANQTSWLDEIIMRGNDIVFAFPSLVIAILITALLGPSAINAMIAIGIFNIPVFARVTRGAALSLWQRDYILAAKIAGKNNVLISCEHILPNIRNTLIVQATIQFSIGILSEAALAYVGLGAQPPLPSWGRMLADSQTMVSLAPHVALVPGLAIVILVLGVNLFGDGLRNYFDPKIRGSLS